MEMLGTVSCVYSHCGLLSYKADVFFKGCWLRKELKADQLLTEFIWKWIAALLVAILYTIMFMVMRGLLIFDDGVWYWYRNHVPRDGAGKPETQEEKYSKWMAKLLLL